MRIVGWLIVVSFFTVDVHAQMQNMKPAGVNGAMGVGFATFDVSSPDEFDIKFDQATYVYLGGEKGFDWWNFYLTISLQYMTTTGESNYSYTTVSGGTTYTGTDISFNATFFQAGLGLKFKLIDGYWFRPYIEGGGLGGYFQIAYGDRDKITSSPPGGTDPKTKDSLLDFGRYVEGGLEIDFSQEWGIKAGARFITSETKKLETLDDKTLIYNGAVYYLAVLKQF